MNKKYCVYFKIYFVLLFYSSLSKEVCYTDGGYDSGQNCLSKCFSFSEKTPYIRNATPARSFPNDFKSTWCSTVEDYDHLSVAKQEKWGYCKCVWEPENIFYADGGGVIEPIRCSLGGEVLIKNLTFTFSSSGCEDINTDSPFRHFYLHPPKDRYTNTNKWCPTTSIYNGTTTSSTKQDWGYCLTRESTRNPTTSPTAKPTTSQPTNFPTTPIPTSFPSTSPTTSKPTESPTSSKPTSSPTAFTQQTLLLADGAGVGFNTPSKVNENGFQPCIIPFTYTSGDGNVVEFHSCANINTHRPFHSTNTFPDPPTDPRTDINKWCAIDSANYRINSNPNRLRKNWGYCLEMNTTRAPSSQPTLYPTFPPSLEASLSPTQSPATLSPTAFPKITNIPTSQPSDSPTTFEMRYFGAGGGLNSNETWPCAFPFRIAGGMDWFNNCISFAVEEPWRGNTSSPLESVGLDVNAESWCAVKAQVYERDILGRRNWGYCASSVATTSETTSTPTESPIIDGLRGTITPTVGSGSSRTALVTGIIPVALLALVCIWKL